MKLNDKTNTLFIALCMKVPRKPPELKFGYGNGHFVFVSHTGQFQQTGPSDQSGMCSVPVFFKTFNV